MRFIPSSGPNRHRSTSAKVLMVFIFLMGIVAAFTLYDAISREELEWSEAPSSLGDTDYFDRLEEVEFEKPILKFRDELYYRQEEGLSRHIDYRMYKSGRDSTDSYFIYEAEGDVTNTLRNEVENTEIYYLKVKDRKYLRIGVRPKLAPAEKNDTETN